MSIAPATVVIYNKEGKPEKHSRANARDLVQHCGYSWLANIKSQPNHPASYAGQKVPKGKTLPQEILDRVGSDRDDDGASSSAAERAIEQEAEEQRQQLALMQAAAEAASKPESDEEIPDFSAPVAEEADPETEAALEDDGDDEAEGDEPVLQPTTRSRRRIGRNS